MTARGRRNTGARRAARGIIAAAVVALGIGGPAHADPPVPTDYLTEVVSVIPDIDGLYVGVVGGDSFVEMTAPSGSIVVVEGYQGEPFLQFLADGTVQENRRSPTTWISQDRYGSSPIPASASADADPEWRTVASDGHWAWHDHRTHWMGRQPPFGLRPGDQVLDAVVPASVDGVDVEIRFVSTWQPPPSSWPAVGGVLLMLVAVAGLVTAVRRRPDRLGAVVLALAGVTAAMTTVVGVWQHRSLPAETGSPVRGWLLPLSALALVLLAVLTLTVAGPSRRARLVNVVPLVGLFVGVQLGQWWWLRRSVLGRAVLPTDAPFWFDRAVTAAVAPATVALVVLGARGAVRWLLAPARPAV